MILNTTHDFTLPLLTWYDKNGRKSLPWQTPVDPYRIWVSEIMLQQTQVKTVIPYFERFITRFPTVNTLAAASIDEVLSYWSGLGYYSRGRNLHKAAQIIENDFKGQFPKQYTYWLDLPGIGESTAAAICSLGFNQKTPILDGNVRRVLCRYFLIDQPVHLPATQKKLWDLAQKCMSEKACREYTQAIMDLGALCCTRHNPQCDVCPLSKTCLAFQHHKTRDLPVPKPKIIRPTRQQHFLLIKHDQKIYLEKRPSSGIWGGLWCLPDINYITKDKPNLLCVFKHSFTHFHLEITASTLNIEQLDLQQKNWPGKWFYISDLDSVGVPAAIRKIFRLGITTT